MFLQFYLSCISTLRCPFSYLFYLFSIFLYFFFFFFSSRRRHTRFKCDWSSDVCSSDLAILVGDDPASQIYVRNKARACAEAGIASFEYRLPADADIAAILELVTKLDRKSVV